MKKLTMLAVAAIVAFGFASCAKESSGGGQEGRLRVKLGGGQTRSVGDAGEGVKVAVKSGYVYVFDGTNLVHGEALTAAAQEPTGQELAKRVPVSSKVYVIANAPEDVSGLTSMAEIQAKTSLVNLQNDYTKAAMGNSTADAVAITPTVDEEIYSAAVTLRPLITRLELDKITGTNDMGTPETTDDQPLDFTVKGVYVDNYFNKFNYVGGGTELFDNATFNGLGDAADLAAVTGVAENAANAVWAYNIGAGNLPKLIVKLDVGGEEKYITVVGYKGVTKFEPGTIYHVANLKFTGTQLADEPNPTDVKLLVTVDVDPWKVVAINETTIQ